MGCGAKGKGKGKEKGKNKLILPFPQTGKRENKKKIQHVQLRICIYLVISPAVLPKKSFLFFSFLDPPSPQTFHPAIFLKGKNGERKKIEKHKPVPPSLSK